MNYEEQIKELEYKNDVLRNEIDSLNEKKKNLKYPSITLTMPKVGNYYIDSSSNDKLSP